MSAKLKTKLFCSLIAITIAFFSGFSPAFAGEPTDQIRTAIDKGIEILKGANLKDKKQREAIIHRLREVVYPLFDFQEMAKRSLGSHWRRLDANRQKEFVVLFTQLLEKTYADRIDLYDGQQVAYLGEEVDQNYAHVDSTVVDLKGQSFSVRYKLHRVDGKWRIYDVVAENISIVNNYRSQFHRVIVNSSYDDLVKRIKDKAS